MTPSPNDEAARLEFVSLMEVRENRPAHVRHVTRLALRLFDDLAPLHGLGPRARLLLEAAGHLHDIGHGTGPATPAHHKESARLIRAHPWRQFSREEVEIIAQVSRYHRKAMPEMDHEEFRQLPAPDRRTVQFLAALLRLADSLDRTHSQAVEEVAAEIRPNQLVLHLTAHGPIPREARAVHRKADLAIAMFQRDLIVMLGDEVLPPGPPDGPERD